jgi:hypothetical protein
MGTRFIFRLDEMDVRFVHELVESRESSLASSLQPTITCRGSFACLSIFLIDSVCISMRQSHKLMLDCCDSCVRLSVWLWSWCLTRLAAFPF